jgi:hypothetical protein
MHTWWCEDMREHERHHSICPRHHTTWCARCSNGCPDCAKDGPGPDEQKEKLGSEEWER